MKWIKYIISFLIMFIGLLIIGESHIFYLDNFYTQYDNTTLYLQSRITSEEMITDILDSAARNEVEVFTYIRLQPNISLAEYEIYGTSGVEKYINENSNIFEGKYTSLFVGNINIEFNDIENTPNIENMHDYYIIGSKGQVHQFKMDLIDKYAGNHPKEGYPDKESRNNTVAIWLLIISIILLLSFYDVILQKKENVVRVSMGEKISKIIWKNIILDSLVFSSIFTGILFILTRYTHVFFNFKISIIAFIFLLCINGLLYLNIYFYDIKEVFSNGKGSKNLLSLNYGLKLVTTIITIFIISSNIAFISQSYSLYKQKIFFEDHSDYYYIKFMYRPIENSDGSMKDRLDETASVQARFYREFFEEFHVTALKDISDYLRVEGILANTNYFDYLSNKIDELRGINLDKDFYFLLPENMKESSEVIGSLEGYIRFNEGNKFDYDYDVIYYHDNVDIVGIDEDTIYGSNLVKNPAIIYNNMAVDKVKSQSDDNDLNGKRLDYLYDTMYKISSDDELDEFNKFLVEYNLQDQNVQKTNVLKKYKNSWIIAKRILYINLVFSVLILLLEFIIISSIIRLEYEVNAIELSIKKVMGYSVLEKNRKIIMMTVITTILSMIIAVIVARIMETKEAYYLAFGGTIILILELFVITFYIHRIENSKIQKILKGGNL
ncbi:hypothetical protein SH2C18_44760 [Clostridium sediminicola]|uniref:DUF1430 domain-containing protein n=1 Tax=Clostridium sediminicola TaxID=3114879 RepID=UPI0031F20EC2